MRKTLWICLGSVLAAGLAFSTLVSAFGTQLLSIYITDSPEAISYGLQRIGIVCSAYFICGMMDVSTGALRGMGASVVPMVICLLGACGFRIFWVAAVFPLFRTPQCLFYSYPLSWALTFLCQMAAFFVVYRKRTRMYAERK